MIAVPESVAASWLETGDQMDRREFRWRYEHTPDDFRAELVEGVVYVASPVRYGFHDRQVVLIVNWLSAYSMQHAGVEVGLEASLALDDSNEYHADGFLWRTSPPGSLRLLEDGYLEGVPELVVEVAASTKSRDLNAKYRVYERNGVQEYVVWRVLENAIDWFRSADGKFVRVGPDAAGIIESSVFPGLRLNIAAALAMDTAAVVAELNT